MADNENPVFTHVVQTTDGPVRGMTAHGMQQFLGMPYAAPPIGELRWRPPMAPSPWDEPFDAITFGNVCAQDTTCLPGFGYASDTEDCLYLNVFAPADVSREDKLPVMFWIPGGGLVTGGSTDYDPSALVVDNGIVFVSLNYRLNAFGFFSHPSINAEDHPAGNYGIMDQQFALQWVRRNIEGFGGDPENVTIFGESAGGISVLAHMASPGSAGLFHRAITQSCSVAATTMTATLQSQEHMGTALISAAGCDDQTPDNLRAIPASALLAANAAPAGTFSVGEYYIGLVADGHVVPEPMRDLFSTGRFNRVPLMNGVNRDEFTWFQAMVELSTGHVLTDEEYPHVIGPVLDVASRSALLGAVVPPEAIPEILELYPADSYASPSLALAAAIGDCGLITNGGRRMSRMIKEFVPDVYAYEFDVPDSPVAWPDVSFAYSSGHVQEIQYIFPGFSLDPPIQLGLTGV